MNKMYLENNNAGRVILVTDGVHWYAWDGAPSGYVGDIDLYRQYIDENGEEIECTDEQIANDIREGIKAGAIYSADDFIIENNADELAEHEIENYHGMTIDDIDRRVNYTSDGYPLGHDITSWIEI